MGRRYGARGTAARVLLPLREKVAERGEAGRGRMRGRAGLTDYAPTSFASDASVIAISTSWGRLSICWLENRRTRKPSRRSQASRTSSSAGSWCGPSASTTSRCRKADEVDDVGPLLEDELTAKLQPGQTAIPQQLPHPTLNERGLAAHRLGPLMKPVVVHRGRMRRTMFDVDPLARPLIRPRFAGPPSPARGEGRWGYFRARPATMAVEPNFSRRRSMAVSVRRARASALSNRPEGASTASWTSARPMPIRR